jgi:hypothetical protein
MCQYGVDEVWRGCDSIGTYKPRALTGGQTVVAAWQARATALRAY